MASESRPRLAGRIGLFDATMIVMGGMVGAGIFINPYVVAQRVHSPVLMLAVWVAGGVIAAAWRYSASVDLPLPVQRQC